MPDGPFLPVVARLGTRPRKITSRGFELACDAVNMELAFATQFRTGIVLYAVLYDQMFC